MAIDKTVASLAATSGNNSGGPTELPRHLQDMRRGNAAGVATKDAIPAVAAFLFNDSGYHQTTMDDIAGALGLSKGSLYYHFKSKEEVLARIHEDFMDQLQALYTANIGTGTAPSHRVRMVIVSILELMATHREHVRVFFEHHRELGDGRKGEIRARRRQFEQLLVAALEDGKQVGEFRHSDSHLVAVTIFGMCNWSYQWFRGGLAEAHAAAEAMCDLLLNGLHSDATSAGDPATAP